ncbi:AraC family transcriptional regulator [Desulfovibrio sp. JC022]|uniref:AraC family transcriptional regulator n=1 Tax=Desulfovibrio sp. JC022 TaxID=2593642 RepID=UPI0013D25AE0|nr:AraC family transcriptional regulator [Desulfovibrio sp. JC022]NDV23722.1 AraC family transcriptional regulator [Desulfovibrio sp. JC022]
MTKQNEILIFHELEGMPDVALVEATGIANHFPRHVHSSFIFSLIDCGERKVSINSQIYSYRAGEMCILPPGTPHSCESISGNKFGPHSYRTLCVSTSYLQKLTEEISGISGIAPHFKPELVYTDFEEDSFNDLFALQKTTGTMLEKQTALNTFLYHAIEHFSTQTIILEQTGPQHEALDRVKQYVDKNFKEKITLNNIADIGCLSPFHLQKLFVKRYGISPQEYIISRRIHEAKSRIQSGESLTEAALNSGFSDQSHFSRHFKRVIGISPGRFLRENR